MFKIFIFFSKFSRYFFPEEITNSKLKKKKFTSIVIHFISKIIPDMSVKKKKKKKNEITNKPNF